MKRILVFAVLLAACSALGPRDVAEHYLTSLANLDFGAAAGDVAGEGKTNLQMIERLQADLTPEERDKFRIKDWKVTDHSQMGDSATVNFLFDKTKQGQLTLKNYAGTWKVVSRRTF